jgi:hypothetical protein
MKAVCLSPDTIILRLNLTVRFLHDIIRKSISWSGAIKPYCTSSKHHTPSNGTKWMIALLHASACTRNNKLKSPWPRNESTKISCKAMLCNNVNAQSLTKLKAISTRLILIIVNQITLRIRKNQRYIICTFLENKLPRVRTVPTYSTPKQLQPITPRVSQEQNI